MAEPTLLGDIIQPAWEALTPEQRTCWHIWAQRNPQSDARGRLTTLYGQQAHYQKNAPIAVAETVPLLADPPTSSTKPKAPKITSSLWPLKSKPPTGPSSNRPIAYVDFVEPLDGDTLVVIRQSYTRKLNGKGRPPRIRHVTIVPPLGGGEVILTESIGYFATTAGLNRFAKIRGVTAKRRPDKPLGSARVINLLNGQIIQVSIPNPYGGTRKKSSRARATQIKPTPGDHWP